MNKGRLFGMDKHIEENNKLIAEFMGLPIIECTIGTESEVVTRAYMHPRRSCPFTADGLQYKYSWNWLMPVVGRISDISEEPEELDGLKYALLTNNLEEAWFEVVKLINWYNGTKTKGSCTIYQVENVDNIVKEFSNDRDFVEFVNNIQEENSDKFILQTTQQCINYINEFCDNLILEIKT